jgi:hypothetical protein
VQKKGTLSVSRFLSRWSLPLVQGNYVPIAFKSHSICFPRGIVLFRVGPLLLVPPTGTPYFSMAGEVVDSAPPTGTPYFSIAGEVVDSAG